MKKNALLVMVFCLATLTIPAQHLKHVLGEVIVQLEYGSTIDQITPQLNYFNGVRTGLQLKKELSPPLRIWLLTFDHTKIDENDFLQKIQRLRKVENAQLNHLGEFRQLIPDDPAFEQQWMWLNLGQTGGLEDADIDLDLAWEITTGGTTADGQEIVVCVVEGANRNHPDLQGNLWYNEAEIEGDGIDNDGNGYIDDYEGWHVNLASDNVNDNGFGHGTFVSGAIGAKGNNTLMVAGVNWNVKIMHVDFSGVNEANAIAAYTYPLVMRRKYNETGGQKGAFVVATNSSWGIDNGNPDNAPIWCAFYDSLGQAGILSCGATANNNVNIDIVGDLPTGCSSEYLLSVTASDHEDVRTFSAYGLEQVDLAAPGDDFVSLNLNGGPATSSGTSYASPTVAGVIALLYAAPCSSLGAQALGAPAATAEFIRDAIFLGVDTISNLQGEVKYGGRLNAYNSLQYVLANCGPCPRPFGVQITDFIDVNATLAWFSTDSTLTTDMLFRELGTPDWDTLKAVSSPYFFSDLQACTAYEVQLQDNCANDSSGFTTPLIFQTDGCCVPPFSLTVVDFDNVSASVIWEPIFAANSYNLEISSSNGSALFQGLTATSFDFSGLDICTDYSVRIQTVCDTGATSFSNPVEFKTSGCGSCTDLPYCPSASVDASSEWIANVLLNDLNNTSASDNGYGDFTNLSTDLLTFQTYQISLTPGYSGFNYNEWFSVYIDFNQDGDFDDTDEEVFDTGGSTTSMVQGQIFVPGDAVYGSTRMRVVMKFNSKPGSCEAAIDHGEVEDYCVNIQEGIPVNCDIPDSLFVDNISPNNAEFFWRRAADALSYDFRIRDSLSNWLVIAAQDTFFTASNLLECVNYECQVRSVCSGTKSEWSSSILFKTECIIGSADDWPEKGMLHWSLYPNPLRDQLNLDVTVQTASNIQLEIYTAGGRRVYSGEHLVRQGENKLQLSGDSLNHLTPGIYFVKLITSRGAAVKRIVKN